MDENKLETKTKTEGKALTLFKGFSKKSIIVISVVMLLIIGLGAFVMASQNKEGQLTTISKSSLQKIIEINELSTVDYTYNATVTKYAKDDKSEVAYYVAYEGTVTAGIDFQKIGIDVNEKEKIVTFTVPEVVIHSVSVDMGTMDYIFVNEKYETETISQEAYKLCKADLEKRIKKEELLYTSAKDNAISSVEALFKPWIETIDEEYKIEIK